MLQDEEGYTINNINFKALVDSRTGFYKIIIILENKNNKSKSKIKNKNKNKRMSTKAVKYNFTDDWSNGILNSIISHPKSFKLNKIFLRHDDFLYYLIRDLSENGYSLKRSVIASKNNIRGVYYKYKVYNVLNRPDLSNTNKKGFRQPTLLNKTIKNKNTSLTYMYNPGLFSKEEINNAPLYTNEELAELQKYDVKD
jgi:hypothetical protein